MMKFARTFAIAFCFTLLGLICSISVDFPLLSSPTTRIRMFPRKRPMADAIFLNSPILLELPRLTTVLPDPAKWSSGMKEETSSVKIVVLACAARADSRSGCGGKKMSLTI